MMGEEKRHEPYKARTIITRHRLGFIEHSDADDKKRDKEWENFSSRLLLFLKTISSLRSMAGKRKMEEVILSDLMNPSLSAMSLTRSSFLTFRSENFLIF